MYWINSRALKNKLRSGDFSERDAIPYIIAQGILINLSFLGDSPETATSLITIGAGILGVILGTLFVFKKHDPNSNSSFLKKYVSLSWVVTIHCTLLLIPFLIVTILLAATTGAKDVIFEAAPATGAVLLCILYYVLLGKHISET